LKSYGIARERTREVNGQKTKGDAANFMNYALALMCIVQAAIAFYLAKVVIRQRKEIRDLRAKKFADDLTSGFVKGFGMIAGGYLGKIFNNKSSDAILDAETLTDGDDK
jgi:hypothetical protein